MLFRVDASNYQCKGDLIAPTCTPVHFLPRTTDNPSIGTFLPFEVPKYGSSRCHYHVGPVESRGSCNLPQFLLRGEIW